MNQKKTPTIEEVSAEEVEVISADDSEQPDQDEEIIRIKADDDVSPLFARTQDTAFAKMFENIEEVKKLKPFGGIALLLSVVGIKFYPIYLCIIAIILAVLDIVFGSKYTKKISIAAIIIAVLSLLNTWS